MPVIDREYLHIRRDDPEPPRDLDRATADHPVSQIGHPRPLPERDRAWARIVALAPGYGKYEQQTDREIPVVRLTLRP